MDLWTLGYEVRPSIWFNIGLLCTYTITTDPLSSSSDPLRPYKFCSIFTRRITNRMSQTHSTISLQFDLHHHTAAVNTLSINPEGDRLLSAGKYAHPTIFSQTRANLQKYTLGNDAKVIIWILTSGEKLQVIACPFNGAVGAAVWFPSTSGLRHGFAFGCADGSIHVYTSDEVTVCRDLTI